MEVVWKLWTQYESSMEVVWKLYGLSMEAMRTQYGEGRSMNLV